jgi:hypothetical protein
MLLRRAERPTTVSVMTEEWTAPLVERTDPGLILGERRALEAWLDFHRDTLLHKCAGLTAGQLKERAVPPSRLSLLGLVRHMTEVERSWFLRFLGAYDGPIYCSDDNPDGDWDDVDAKGSLRDVERYGVEVDAIRRRLLGHSLDEQEVDDGTTYSLRWIYTHMLEEYARHNGHADLLREAIDGSVGA